MILCPRCKKGHIVRSADATVVQTIEGATHYGPQPVLAIGGTEDEAFDGDSFVRCSSDTCSWRLFDGEDGLAALLVGDAAWCSKCGERTAEHAGLCSRCAQ